MEKEVIQNNKKNTPMTVRMKDGSVNRDQQMERLKPKMPHVKCKEGKRFTKTTKRLK